MKKIFKKYFIPHKANDFHPHILHTKRAIFYSLVFLLTKIIVVVFVIFLPIGAFVLPDVLAEEQRQIVALTNQARREKNLPELVVSSKLDLSAQNKADDMAAEQYFAHVKDKKGLSTWLKGVSYNYEVAGENLAVGFSNAGQIVAAWKNSPTHYANLIDSDFKDLGVGLAGGVYNGRATVFIAQHLGTPVSEKIPAKKTVGKKSSSVEVKEVATTVATTISSPVTSSLAQASSSVLAGKIKNSDEDEPVVDFSQPTPVDKYIHAKRVLSPLTSIFAISQNIYIIAMVFFGFSLLLSLAVSVRKQRYHIIAQTGGLIALLFIFWKF